MRTFIFTGLIAAVALTFAAQITSKASDASSEKHYRYVKAALVASHSDDTPMFSVNSDAKQDKKPFAITIYGD
jgi:hypothetical protein